MERTKTKRFIKEEKGKVVKDKRAVSPVIGVILMVAITVILAAVIAAFVFGISPAGEKTPNAQLRATVGLTGGTLELKHMGGDPINLDDCTIKCKDKTWASGVGTWGNLIVGERESNVHGETIGTGDAVAVEIIHIPSQSYLLDTTVTAGA